MNQQPNPIRQGIALQKQLDALEHLMDGADTVDPDRKDAAVNDIRITLDAQIVRARAELTALCSLYQPAPY